jgi:RNA polymerase sigma-70 factor (ECF subfamily)
VTIISYQEALELGRDLGMDCGDRVWRERALRGAVLAGDENAWRTLYDASYAGLQAYAMWRCAGMRDRADDVVQETWLTAVRRLRDFDPERGSFASWLRGIASHVLHNYWRRARLDAHARSLNGLDRPAPSDPAPQQRETARRIARALAELPERYEAVLRAKYLDQNSVEQIAGLWNETAKAIESVLTRARHAFREAYLNME